MATCLKVSFECFDNAGAREESFSSGDPWERTVEKMVDTRDKLSVFGVSFFSILLMILQCTK